MNHLSPLRAFRFSTTALATVGALALGFAGEGCSSSSGAPADGGEAEEGSSSSSSSGGTTSSGSSGGANEGGGSTSSSSGGPVGSCDAGIFSYSTVSAAGMMIQCTASEAPTPPGGFTLGHCPSAGLVGCCVNSGPCGLTGNCTYLAAAATSLMSMCTGTWQTSAP